jgi:hypothetical protein
MWGDRINFIVDPNGSFGSDSTLVQAEIQHGAVAAETQRTIAVPILGDEPSEADETLLLNLTGGTVAVNDHQGMATIEDEDPLVTIGDASVIEGDSGTANLRFTVSLSKAPTQTGTVVYATTDGAASAGSDYQAVSGTLIFEPGQPTEQTIQVPVIGDAADEIHESLLVDLFDAGNANIADAQGTGTITDDDDPNLSSADASVIEGDSGVTQLVFAVTLSADPAETVTVDYATADGTATAREDYCPTGGTLTFSYMPDFEIDLASPDQTVFDSDSLTFTGTEMAPELERLTISSGDGADTFDVGSAQITLVDDLRISAADGRLTLAGGTIDADTLDFVGGELSGYGTVDAAIAGLARIEADGGALDLGDGSYGAFHHDGELDVGAETVALNTAGLANLGSVTSIDGGTLVAPGGVVLSVGDNLVGQGTVAGRVAAATGSTILATGDLELGDAGSFAGFFSDGELYVGNHTVTIQDQDVGMLGSLTEIGSADGSGTLTAPNGLLLEAGKTAFGYGVVNGDFVNQGHVIGGGPQPDDELEFTGDVSGTGSFDGNIVFSKTYSPGNSPAEVDFFHNVTFTSTATLEIELGGTLAGEFDALAVVGQAALDGTLDVVLLPGFSPSPGDRFRVMTVGLRTGDFAVTNLPSGFVATWEGNSLILEQAGAQVVGRHIFYNHSYFDGNDSAANTDDDNANWVVRSGARPRIPRTRHPVGPPANGNGSWRIRGSMPGREAYPVSRSGWHPSRCTSGLPCQGSPGSSGMRVEPPPRRACLPVAPEDGGRDRGRPPRHRRK